MCNENRGLTYLLPSQVFKYYLPYYWDGGKILLTYELALPIWNLNFETHQIVLWLLGGVRSIWDVTLPVTQTV